MRLPGRHIPPQFESATIESVARKQLVLLSPWKTMQVNGRPVEINKNGLVVIEVKPGDVLVLSDPQMLKRRSFPLNRRVSAVELYVMTKTGARAANRISQIMLCGTASLW